MAKAIANAVLIGILVLAGASWLVGQQDASVEDVQAAIASAKNLPHGEEIIQPFLRNNPVPTKQQLNQLRDVTNQEQVLALSRKATGDTSLQPTPAAPEEVDRQEQLEQKDRLGELQLAETIELWFYRGYFLLGFGVPIFVWLVIAVVRKVRPAELS